MSTHIETQLKQVADKIKEFQEREQLTDAAVCREFASLGSTKTYKRILAGDFEEMNAERQLENYLRALELTKMRKDASSEAVYRDFRNVRNVVLAVKEAFSERGLNRVVIVEGQTGTGKTVSVKALEDEFGEAVVVVEAHGGWKVANNPIAVMMGDCLSALRLREFGKADARKEEMKKQVDDAIPTSFVKRQEKLFNGLNVRKRILVIEEAQEMGPYCLNTVKSIINRTPTVVVLPVIPTIFRRLESRSYDDAVQLTGNRLYERVRLVSPEDDEIGKFMERRNIHFANGDAVPCLEKLRQKAPIYGNWQFINRFAKKAKSVKGALDTEEFISIITAVEKQMKGTN